MEVKEVLDKNNFNFKKKFGQNFLLDQNILNNIVTLADITKEDLVIEIGVGAGALTKKISPRAKYVLGYEIDKTLEKPLKEILPEENINIIFDDFLSRNIKEDISKYNYSNIIVVANLPYYITTPIISKFIDEKINVSRLVVMVQNEVADRFSANMGSKAYNSLTIFLNYYFDIKKAFVVSRNVFYPKPNVDSAVVIFNKSNKYKSSNEALFFKMVKDAFKQKRKTLKNNLKGYNLEQIDKILNQTGKNISFRAENISIDEFINICDNYCSK